MIQMFLFEKYISTIKKDYNKYSNNLYLVLKICKTVKFVVK